MFYNLYQIGKKIFSMNIINVQLKPNGHAFNLIAFKNKKSLNETLQYLFIIEAAGCAFPR